MPTTFITTNRLKLSSVDALAMLLKRMSYPNRLGDLVLFFGREASVISRFTNEVSLFIHKRWHNLLRWDHCRLTEEVLQSYHCAIWDKGGKLDGPSSNQELVYNGWKGVHALKFQSVVAPDGLILHLDGPYLGKHHDAWILHVSGLLGVLNDHLRFGDKRFCVYGDPAYPVTEHLIGPFKPPRNPEEQEFNKMMSAVRIAVEWGFGMIASKFAFLDFERNLKMLLQPVAQYYLVCGLLLNAMTCLRGNQTSMFFELNPPNLDQYFTDQGAQHEPDSCFHCETYSNVSVKRKQRT
ncbi:hypothetical protein SmJEL517_g06299 [Synchytrium microbalum]|uniref:DDE Tnp4 domain-containing protein n=1 Tax=Synchytrium microbalum TaxID=1806994 RepID=A0A507BQ05_9FUNG|nr:uncharacterized protein SmJEL517_g06299 [Synchytrium microbalum]TPX29992.1 hypothetical protein SmJEL517_g06299 [Synchytrium microbalum]